MLEVLRSGDVGARLGRDDDRAEDQHMFYGYAGSNYT